MRLQLQLSAALTDYDRTRGEAPRDLIIEVERAKREVDLLFDIVMEALDAQSMARTGHTDFGKL